MKGNCPTAQLPNLPVSHRFSLSLPARCLKTGGIIKDRNEISFELQEFYFSQPEPLRSCFLALRDIILRFDDAVSEEYKYRLPYFHLNGKSFCYLWKDKKTQQPYIGIHKGAQLEHPALVAGERTYVKILPIDVDGVIPEKTIFEVLEMARDLQKKK